MRFSSLLRRSLPAAAGAAILLSASGCIDRIEAPDWSDPLFIDFHPALGIDLDEMTRTASGLYLEDLEIGDGPLVEIGDSVAVWYIGCFPDARCFDAAPGSIEEGGAVTFEIRPQSPDSPGLIRGFAEGVEGMQVGGHRKLILPPDLGYGSNGTLSIPPNTTLFFEVYVREIIGKWPVDDGDPGDDGGSGEEGDAGDEEGDAGGGEGGGEG